MTTAITVLFWVATAAVLIGFGCAVAQNFVGEKAKKVLNWIVIGCSIVAFACYAVREALMGNVTAVIQ